MPVYLSPGVYPREIDLSITVGNTSGIIPAFIGTAQKGPMNDPQFITTAEQLIDTFGAPIPEANLGYAVIACLEEGNGAWVLRVGVECDSGQPDELADICIDTSGARGHGWGRVAVFRGIDFGTLVLRIPDTDNPLSFHQDRVYGIGYNDIDVSTTDGPTVATLDFVGSDLSDSYIGSIDDSFTVLITGDPTSGTMDGASYEIYRNSDGAVIGSGTIIEDTSGFSAPIAVGSGDDDSGLIFRIVVTGSSPIEQDDTFVFFVEPDNRVLRIEVEGLVTSPVSFTMPTASYTDPDDFVTAFNLLVGSSVGFLAGNDGTRLLIRTRTAGERIQLVGTEAFALEIGLAKWSWDIPRSYLVNTNAGPYNINSNNNRVTTQAIESDNITELNATVATSLTATPTSVATSLHMGGITFGERYYESFALQVTDDEQRVVIAATSDHQFSRLKMMADFSHIRTLRFAEETDFPYPYTREYRVFNDSRVILPDAGVTTPSMPLSCETDPFGAQCALDTSYFQNIVGFIVATSPGTWLEGFTLTLENYNNESGRYVVRVYDSNGVEEPDARVDNISFDPDDDRYIGKVVNPGSVIGGPNGNAWVNWEERPVFLENDPNDSTNYVIRQPGEINRGSFTGLANGIPLDAVYASELDRAVIGSPDRSTGIFAFQNPEVYDIALLVIPGFSSGSVIGQALQMCEGRGDCLYIVDPPFGLRPQQVVDWHNGMLFTDLQNSLNSSYGALYWSWVEIFDQYNGGTIFIPPSGHIASVFARTARVAEPWFAPAGLNRGRLLTVRNLEYSPTQGERDLLYGFNNAVNALVNFPQDGITVWGQRTLQRADSALDRVNVRMLLIVLKKALVPLLRNYIFEPNDRFLWEQVDSVVRNYLSDIQARRGLTAYDVIVDERNNTPVRRDRNELWVSLLLKPTRAVEFIALNLVILRTDHSFAAEEVLAAAGIAITQEF
ncbi:MAG: phage tail sheath subtilisin-like domain-containing protein [Deltaproteobacteria bacterium]|nr:phage tail sheath subtilisin-like domain-containing protein [Deltaproteobacteria bacterium]